LTTPIGPPRLWVKRRSDAAGSLGSGPIDPGVSRRGGRPRTDLSIRKGSFFFNDHDRSLGRGRETVLMESATHPRVISGRLAPTLDHAGVCEFHQAAEEWTSE